ncbi:c-type cytochrome [Gorillibacterium sp. sgz5001074]|uniref:c-type cytochrome n=1 Tax=Gorillibacterium sp. sgz5001074 TaxID=3446695 RepID=UPI003F661778
MYKDNCMACHGVNLEGKMGPELTKVGGHMTKDEILTQILKGGGRMPAQEKRLSAAETETLAVWLAAKK